MWANLSYCPGQSKWTRRHPGFCTVRVLFGRICAYTDSSATIIIDDIEFVVTAQLQTRPSRLQEQQISQVRSKQLTEQWG
jgi:hypothetical protein